MEQAVGDGLTRDFTQMTQFTLAGCGRDVDHLEDQTLEFRKFERAVVRCCWETESVGDEALLARPVAVVHAPDLRKTDVRFVHDDEVLFRVSMELVGARREEIKQAIGTLARFTTIKVERIVFDRLTVANFPQHFEVVFGLLLQSIALRVPCPVEQTTCCVR